VKSMIPVQPAPVLHRDFARGVKEAGWNVGLEVPHHQYRLTPPPLGWAAAAIVQAGPALGPVAVDPPVGALPGDTQLLGDVGHRPPVEDDTTYQQASAVNGQPGISAGHQDLRDE
jgi:hypothetical protein